MRLEVEVAFSFGNDSTASVNQENDAVGNNVSNKAHITQSENYTYKGKRGFQFAKKHGEWPATADGSYQYFEDAGYKGFMSKALCDVSGNFSEPLLMHLEVGGKMPEYLFLQFDRVSSIYATKIKITNNYNSNSVTVNNKRTLAMIDLSSLGLGTNIIPDNNLLLLTIEFISMNKPFQSLRLTQMSLTYLGVFADNDLISCENSEQLFESQMLIKPGIVSQYADIRVYDRTNILHEFAKREILSTRQTVTIRAYDDENNPYELGTYKADDWDVEDKTNEVALSCADTSEQLDNKWSNPAEIATRSVHDLLYTAFNINGAQSWSYIDKATEQHCKNIVTANSWYYSSTVKELLEKICQLGQLRIYDYLGNYVVARCY